MYAFSMRERMWLCEKQEEEERESIIYKCGSTKSAVAC